MAQCFFIQHPQFSTGNVRRPYRGPPTHSPPHGLYLTLTSVLRALRGTHGGVPPPPSVVPWRSRISACGWVDALIANVLRHGRLRRTGSSIRPSGSQCFLALPAPMYQIIVQRERAGVRRWPCGVRTTGLVVSEYLVCQCDAESAGAQPQTVGQAMDPYGRLPVVAHCVRPVTTRCPPRTNRARPADHRQANPCGSSTFRAGTGTRPYGSVRHPAVCGHACFPFRIHPGLANLLVLCILLRSMTPSSFARFST